MRLGRLRGLLAVLVLASITLMTADARSPSLFSELRRGAVVASANLGRPFFSVASTIGQSVSAGIHPSANAKQIEELEISNRQLGQQMGDTGQVTRNLQSLGFQIDGPRCAFARAVDGSAEMLPGVLGAVGSEAMVIDKGSSSGLASGMTVLNGIRVVGTVGIVASTYATVQIVSRTGLSFTSLRNMFCVRIQEAQLAPTSSGVIPAVTPSSRPQ